LDDITFNMSFENSGGQLVATNTNTNIPTEVIAATNVSGIVHSLSNFNFASGVGGSTLQGGYFVTMMLKNLAGSSIMGHVEQNGNSNGGKDVHCNACFGTALSGWHFNESSGN